MPRITFKSGRYRQARSRHGLAPLELILWLPVLLMAMALAVNYANMTCWRIRGEVVARDAVWRERWPRSGGAEPRPPDHVWPASAGMGVRGDDQYGSLNHPNIQHPVVRGPMLELGNPPQRFLVNDTLDQETGAHVGVANIDRDYRFLSSLGRYHSGEVAHHLLTREWQCAQMGFWNTYRRTLVLYSLPQTDPALPEAYVRAVIDLIQIPHFAAQSVLDRDEDWRIYYGGYPNFYPSVSVRPDYGETDPVVVFDRSVRPLVDRMERDPVFGAISRLPRRMTEAYLQMYRAAKAEIERLEAELNGTPPPDPQRRLWIQNRLAQLYQIQNLDGKIEQLERDMRTLAARERQMEGYFRSLPAGP